MRRGGKVLKTIIRRSPTFMRPESAEYRLLICSAQGRGATCFCCCRMQSLCLLMGEG